VDESPSIAEAVSRGLDNNYETGCTALEWFSRRIKNQRISNRKVMHYFAPDYPLSNLTLKSRDPKLGWLAEVLS
jgi:hypothetical protein